MGDGADAPVIEWREMDNLNRLCIAQKCCIGLLF